MATDMAMDRDIPEADWTLYLRSEANGLDLTVRDADLNRWLYEAKAHRDGRIELLRSHTKLNTRPIPWLWQGIIQKQAVNLIHALPKCGKTRLMLGALSAWVHGGDMYLGRELHQGTESLLIVGPDQPEPVWAEVLRDYQLLDENGHMHKRIVGLVPSGGNFALTEKGIGLVEQEARDNPGLVILLDSYQRAIGPMGIDENRPEAAVPLTALMEAVAPHKATLIVIHHSNKGGGDGSISGGARGSSAITAAVDQLVSLKPFGQSSFDDGKEVELKTEGRGGRPVSMVLRLEDDGKTWANTGTLAKRKRDAEDQKLAEDLSEKQRKFTLALVAAWEEDKTALTKIEVGERMGYKDGSILNRMGGWIAPLIDKKGMIEKAGTRTSSNGRPEVLYRPTEKALKYVTKEPPF